MARDIRVAREAAEAVMVKITPEIDTERGLVFLTFNQEPFNAEPARGYFDPKDVRTHPRGVVPVPTRVDLIVPKDVLAKDVRAIVAAIIRDGYDFTDITSHPNERAAKA
jgi:hypothetical protein